MQELTLEELIDKNPFLGVLSVIRDYHSIKEEVGDLEADGYLFHSMAEIAQYISILKQD